MYQAVGTILRALGAKRKDDVTVIGIAALLILLFFVQLAWVIDR